MGEGTESSSSMGGEKGLEDSSLPVNFHGNLASAHNDDELLNLLQQAKASKRTAVVNYGAPWYMSPSFLLAKCTTIKQLLS
jgi:hypothetical protein